MNPILGIIASSKLKSSGSFDSIATVTVGSGGASSIQFTSIPTTYKHLHLRMFLKADATTNGTPTLVYNNDTTSFYTYHDVYSTGSSVSWTGASTNYGGQWYVLGGQNANGFAVYVTDILDYASTSKNKTIRTMMGFDNNGSGRAYFASQTYLNSGTAITSLTLTMQSGNASQYSHAALYGIKD